MRQNGFFLHTDLAPKTSANQQGLLYEAHDYPAIGGISDMVLLMTYEWGYTYGPPMAVAHINRVREVIEYGVSEIPRGKILMGIPNYGYDWPLPFEKGQTRATSIGNEYALSIARRYGASISFDEVAMSPYFEYFAMSGRKHIVWFEDVRSILAKFDLMDEFGLLGAGYWNAMRPFAQNWALVSALYDIRKVI
jgi:spore germination protein